MHNAGRVVADAIAEVARFARVGRHLGSVSVEFPVNQTTFSLTQCDAAGRCHHRSRWRSRRRCRQGRSAAAATGRHSGQGRVHIHNHNGHFNCLTLWKIKWNYLSVRNKAGRLTNGIIIANWTGQKCRRHVFFSFPKKEEEEEGARSEMPVGVQIRSARSRMSVIINSTSFFSFFGICKVFDHFL